jgi:hypothetical protein
MPATILPMQAMLVLLAFSREQLMIAALISLIVASVVVSLGAWILLWKQRRARRQSVGLASPASEEPAG